MNNINEFIKTLSENDKKNLVGKALKTTEEVGELAKAILPYENESGTLHRFVHRRQILENAVDVMLCAMSIAYDLKYTDEDIQMMMHEKASKWSGIQAREGRIKFPLPYEIHVTVDLRSFGSLDTFKEYCVKHNLKPIVIELQKNGHHVMNDVMTSSVHYGDNNTVMTEANNIADDLKIEGYDVVRIKIETVPWHPAAPSIMVENWQKVKMPPNCYFESHLRIITTKKRSEKLERIAKNNSAHLSRNFFKKISDDEYVIMMTLRSYIDVAENFVERARLLREKLQQEGFVVDKMETEFAVYDTNVTHDLEWFN